MYLTPLIHNMYTLFLMINYFTDFTEYFFNLITMKNGIKRQAHDKERHDNKIMMMEFF